MFPIKDVFNALKNLQSFYKYLKHHLNYSYKQIELDTLRINLLDADLISLIEYLQETDLLSAYEISEKIILVIENILPCFKNLDLPDHYKRILNTLLSMKKFCTSVSKS